MARARVRWVGWVAYEMFMNVLGALPMLMVLALGAQNPPAPSSLARAASLYAQAAGLQEQTRNQEALPLAREALSLREAALGPVHLDVAKGLAQVAGALVVLNQVEEAEALYRRSLAIAQALKSPVDEADADEGLGRALHFRDPQAALAWIHRGMALYRTCGDLRGQVQCLTLEGEIHSQAGRVREARACLLQGQPLAEVAGLSKAKAYVLYSLGVAAKDLGDLDQAVSYLSEAARIWGGIGDRSDEAAALGWLGVLQGKRGDWAAVLPVLERSVAATHAAGQKPNEAAMHSELGKAYVELGDLPRARAKFQEAIRLAADQNLPLYMGIFCNNLAAVSFTLGDDDAEGLRVVQQGLAELRKGDYPRALGWCLSWLAQFQFRAGQEQEARASLDQALALQRSIGAKVDEAMALLILGESQCRPGRVPEALPAFESAVALLRATSSTADLYRALRPLPAALHAAGRTRESTDRFIELVGLEDAMRENAFPALSEAQKLTYALRFERSRFQFISHCLALGGQDPQAVRACFEAWLAHKGSVLDAQERLQATIQKSADPAVRAQAKALQESRLQLATLAQGRPRGLEEGEYQQLLKDLVARREAQGIELARSNRAFAAGAAAQRLDAVGLSRLLPAQGAYLDFARIQAFDFQAFGPTAPRYVAFVLRAGQGSGEQWNRKPG